METASEAAARTMEPDFTGVSSLKVAPALDNAGHTGEQVEYGFTKYPLTYDYLRKRTCWSSALAGGARDIARQVYFQLWLSGLNHRDPDGGTTPIEYRAVDELVGAVKYDWMGDSQIFAFTGINEIAGCQSATTSAECIQKAFGAQPWPLQLTKPNDSWRSGSVSEVEFSVLSTAQWTVADEGVVILGTQHSGQQAGTATTIERYTSSSSLGTGPMVVR